jgi:hypothetical protein
MEKAFSILLLLLTVMAWGRTCNFDEKQATAIMHEIHYENEELDRATVQPPNPDATVGHHHNSESGGVRRL